MAVHIPRKQGGRKRERPDDGKLAELYAAHSAAEIGGMYSVSARTVANWVADVRRKERDEQEQAVPEVQEAPDGGVDWIRVVKTGSAGRLVVVLEVTQRTVRRTTSSPGPRRATRRPRAAPRLSAVWTRP